jgi:hypothetical protein
MPSRYVCNHGTRRDRLGNDQPLLLVAPSPAADVDHKLHTTHDPNRIMIVHWARTG